MPERFLPGVLAGGLALCAALVAGPAALAASTGGGGPVWRVQSAPVPADSIASDLGAVSCVLAGPCAAVGSVDTSDGTTDAVAEIWNGTAWTIRRTPDAANSDLAAVSCSSARLCMAVGDVGSDGRLVALAERYRGGVWTAQRPPRPAGATDSALDGVSCPARSACTAVGSEFTGSPASDRLLAERWNGARWRLQHPPAPRAHKFAQFNAVSCATATACVAVGISAAGLFSESSRGGAWTVHTIGLPGGGSDAYLGSVSCTAAAACTAVGDYYNGRRIVSLAERWNGHHWAIERTAAPPDGQSAFFQSVSCAGPGNCVAAGAAGSVDGVGNLLVERWTGKAWAIQETPMPPGADQASFLGVSCPSVFICEGAGYSASAEGAAETLLAERYS
jgi:hypothetical protein